ncbi:MAG TPA: hypothetical protein VEH58_06115 [Dehalococcoidales bacterium]|nr:hypothetical protein [Dehalococcoidales bacterium]
MKFAKQIGSFQAKSDDGELHTIFEFQEFVSVLTSLGNISESETPVKKWTTQEGYAVSQINPDTYRIVRTNEIIRKI